MNQMFLVSSFCPFTSPSPLSSFSLLLHPLTQLSCSVDEDGMKTECYSPLFIMTFPSFQQLRGGRGEIIHSV